MWLFDWQIVWHMAEESLCLSKTAQDIALISEDESKIKGKRRLVTAQVVFLQQNWLFCTLELSTVDTGVLANITFLVQSTVLKVDRRTSYWGKSLTRSDVTKQQATIYIIEIRFFWWHTTIKSNRTFERCIYFCNVAIVSPTHHASYWSKILLHMMLYWNVALFLFFIFKLWLCTASLWKQKSFYLKRTLKLSACAVIMQYDMKI